LTAGPKRSCSWRSSRRSCWKQKWGCSWMSSFPWDSHCWYMGKWQLVVLLWWSWYATMVLLVSVYFSLVCWKETLLKLHK